MLKDQHNAWNPGLGSTIPERLLASVSLFQEGVSSVDYQTACEYSDFSGIDSMQLMCFTPQRLASHVLLVRVTSELSVPDGPNYEDLGIALRGMVEAIEQQYVAAELPALERAYENLREQIRRFITDELEQRVFGQRVSAGGAAPEFEALNHWQRLDESSGVEAHAAKALVQVVNAIVRQRGRLLPNPELISSIATNLACNTAGAELLDELVAPVFSRAIDELGYRKLPYQVEPVVMNVKGASASGKSTIRPQQRQLAEKLGINWADFALISPDYWRKYLFDYLSIGDDYKYAAMLTGRELEIVDKKLDHHVAAQSARGEVPHLLIDRFRFDSFVLEEGRSQDSKLLTRFGHRIFLFFMVTPPAETVVRAWQRGLSTGRYKAVDDLLYHNIEAYTGIPALFLSWVVSGQKQVHFEFLDNNVPIDTTPKTAAFGWNNTMTVLDPVLLMAVDQYRCVNVDARCAEDVLTESENPSPGNFLSQCVERISCVNFADPESATIYARFEKGQLLQVDWESVNLLESTPLKDWFNRYQRDCAEGTEPPQYLQVDEESRFTLGSWQ